MSLPSNENENPYAPPLAEGVAAENEPPALTVAEREIGSVIRVFNLIGWIGAILYGPIVLFCIIAFIQHVIVGLAGSDEILFAAPFNFSIFCLFLAYIYTARRLARRGANAARWATVLSCVMLLGFPLFTIVGVLSLYKLRKHYPAYDSK